MTSLRESVRFRVLNFLGLKLGTASYLARERAIFAEAPDINIYLLPDRRLKSPRDCSNVRKVGRGMAL